MSPQVLPSQPIKKQTKHTYQHIQEHPMSLTRYQLRVLAGMVRTALSIQTTSLQMPIQHVGLSVDDGIISLINNLCLD